MSPFLGGGTRILEWVAIPFSRGSSRPTIESRFPHCRQTLYRLSHQGSQIFIWTPFLRGARILECVAIPFSRGPSWPRGWTRVSRIVGRRFTVWAIREVKASGLSDFTLTFWTFGGWLIKNFGSYSLSRNYVICRLLWQLWKSIC